MRDDTSSPEIVVSERWLASWQSAGAGVRAAVQGAAHDLVRRIRAEPKTAGRRYNTVKGLSVTDVLEIDLTSAWRMVGVYRKARLHLFDFGDHDLVPRFSEADFRRCKASENPAPRALWPVDPSLPRFFVPADTDNYIAIDDSENGREWLYFLSDEQQRACEDVVLSALEARSAPVLLLGGPGTGKTSVLVTALARMVDELGLPPEEIALMASPRLIAYVDACLPQAELHRFIPAPGERRRITLFDDPGTLLSTRAHIEAGSLVVIAVDPLQMSESTTDAELEEFCSRHAVRRLTLTTCYRQKEAVAAQTARVVETVARSSPFLADRKRERHTAARAGVTSLANSVVFANPGGRVEVVESATAAAMEEIVRRLLQGPLWRHAPPVLVAVDRQVGDVADALLGPFAAMAHDRIHLQHGLGIKGLEYQHAVVVVSKKLHAELESGFTGAGRRAYEEYRLMRIPFSRAKDSLTIVIVEADPAPAPG